MKSQVLKSTLFATLGFAAGLLVAQLPNANASPAARTTDPDLADREFLVSVDEIRQNLVFAESFKGSYKGTFELSDGSLRTIELTPMVHAGMHVVEFKDTGGTTYMGLNGTTTKRTLMVQVRDVEAMRALGKAQGW